MNLAQLEGEFFCKLSALYAFDEIKALWNYTLAYTFDNGNPHAKFLEKKQTLSPITSAFILKVLSELEKAKPIQYVLGEADFLGLKFLVNPFVLIPRPETEELVEWLIQEIRQCNAFKSYNVLDIGTGSGCIAISVQKRLNFVETWGLDICRQAIHLAKKNSARHELGVHFLEANILKGDLSFPTKFQAIISNPPYVTKAERVHMHANVLDYEPHLAIFVEDDDPLIFYHKIADFGIRHLHKDGLLFLEINPSFSAHVIGLLKYKGFTRIQLKKDLFGKDRMVKAEFSG